MLERRAEHRVVHHYNRTRRAGRDFQFRHRGGYLADIRHGQRRVRGSFQQHRAQILGAGDRRDQQIASSGEDPNPCDAPHGEMVLEEVLRAAVDWDGVNDGLARAQERENGSHDRRHAAIERERRGGVRLQRDHLGFQNLRVGMAEARVDQVARFAFLQWDAAAAYVEGVLGGLGALESVGRAAKDGWARRAYGQSWVITLRQNFGGRAQRVGNAVVAIMVFWLVGAHGGISWWSTWGV